METIIFILIIVAVVCLLYWRYRKNFKNLVTCCICLITGAPKTGKDLLQNDKAPSDFKKVHRAWSIHNFFCKLFKKENKEEEPLYYVNYEFSFRNYRKAREKKVHKLDRCVMQLTKAHLLREVRFNYRSVISITEASLLNDNMLSVKVKDGEDVNIPLSCFYKLIGHETKGGKLYLNSQALPDLHYAPKRVCSNFFFIQKNINFLGLFHVLYVREMINQDIGNNNFIDDLDTTTRKYIVPFWVHKRYNRYEFSKFTDDLPKSNEPYDINKGLVSFNEQYVNIADRRNKKGVNKKWLI